MKRTDIARFLPLAILLASGLARGAGFEFPDDGAEALGRSGAFAAKADDGTAIYYNPSALADQKGLNILVDSEFINNSVNFQRTDSLGTAIGPAVQNSGGMFIDPFVAVSYQILPRLTIALGIYGPPADGRYQFPGETPPAFNAKTFGDRQNDTCLIGFCPQPGQGPGNYTSPPENGPGADPQKYNLISDNIFVAYPTLSAAWAPIDIIAVGASVQMVYATTQISEATFDGALFENGKHLTSDEVPVWDTIANLNVANSPVREYTGILGVTIKPPVVPLRIGASYRPGFSIVQNGTMTLDYSTVMQYGGGKPATVSGKGTQQTSSTSGSGPVEFDLPMPGEFKSGVDWSFGAGSDLELDFDYTQWSQVGKIYTTPNFAVVANGATTPLPAMTQVNDFQDTWALRLGGDWKLPVPVVRLAVRAGISYETSVYASSGPIDPQLAFPNFQMYAGAVGVTAGLGPVDIVLAYSHVYEPTEDVRNAGTPMTQNVPAGTPAPPAVVVGNGNYTTSYDVLAAGLRLHFL